MGSGPSLSWLAFSWLAFSRPNPIAAVLLGCCVLSAAGAQQTADLAATVAPFRWRGIGPANMMGRIAAIDALDRDWRTVLIGSASGGVFLSRNGGVTWTPIFDRYGSGSIGDVALCQADPDVIWVGTGEATNRNSVGWGDGVYRSSDGGRTFKNVGLEDTQQIAEIAPHPTDPQVAWVAAVGALWGSSGRRGLFRTVDGGASWQRLSAGLPDDPDTGCTEIAVDPSDPRVLLCGMYARRRGPATMHSGGPHGGVFRSKDGGDTWEKLTAGLPTGDTGMIDIAFHRADPRIVVANVEADGRLPDDLSVPGPGVYRSDDGGDTWRYLLRHATRPFYHGQIAIDPLDPDRIYAVSRDFQVSRDGGRTWRSKWWGGGGDDHDLWISPQDPRVRFMATDQGAYLTVDDGATVVGFDNMAIGQYYAIGVDMRDPYWIGGGLQDNGLWLGPSNSRERRGILNCHNTWIAEGDGFHVQIDPTDWRTVYTVNHVGFVARQDVETREHAYVTPTPETIADFADHVDLAHPETATRYTIDPGEHWFFGERPERPKLPPQFRFNWSSPLVMSPHDPCTLYFGGNHLFVTEDRGDTWRIASPDLTTDDPALRNPSSQGGLTREVTGGENHCTIVTIAPSPIDPRVVWIGTDDGNLQVTRDGGASWQNLRAAVAAAARLRDGSWVSRVEASHFDVATCWATLDDHRRDDMRACVLVTRDFGATWRDLGGDLPDGSLYVVREDPRNPRLLFVGGEFGVHCSLDGGASWTRFMHSLPTVAVHDLVIHPRDADLVAGTHGRSIWIADDVTPLQQCTPEVLAAQAHLFTPRVATKWHRIDLGRKQPDFLFRGENPPRGALLHVWLARAPESDLAARVLDAQGRVLETLALERRAGLQRVRWDLAVSPTDEDRDALRARLLAVIADVRARAPERAEPLARIAAELDRARGTGGLNAVRRRLVEDFAAFAKGAPYFGEKLGSRDAPAGEYRVELEVGGRTLSTTLTVRDDPLGR